MKAREKNVIKSLPILVMVFMLALSFAAYAAPAATQKSTQQSQPTTSTTSRAYIKYDPNAPPNGTITLTASTKGNVNASIWFPETYQYVEWTCKGTSSNLVDVTLWHNNSKYVDIGKGISSGQTGYRVPTNMAEGNYELRITSQDDPRVEARKAIYVKLFEVTTITAPKANEVLYLGDKYTITWTYKGTPGPLNFSLRTDKWDSSRESVQQMLCFDGACLPRSIGQFSSIKTGMGQGSVVWTLPDQPPQDLTNLFYLAATARRFIDDDIISPKFYLACKHSYCNGYCANLLTDVWSCGWCGHRCSDDGNGLICDQGKCKCPPNLATCQGQKISCTDMTKDPGNCGSCGNDCEKVKGPGFNCMNGSCGCYYGKTVCGNKCTDLQYGDPYNCGACGNKCPDNKFICGKGVCTTFSLTPPHMPKPPCPFGVHASWCQ